MGEVRETREERLRRRSRRERPLLIVNTGYGKGKSTAAFGIMLRGWARGYRIGVYQFVKSGKWRVGEHEAAL
ncbi:MAG: cob(I)yrinic acid a,c-diamide adenosyltransferase [Rubrobacteraceae bacterium]|nr:cob(I)yrinic acid a,c-diamide adenosyltransferase [Rubrobacteraceae bacterium]